MTIAKVLNDILHHLSAISSYDTDGMQAAGMSQLCEFPVEFLEQEWICEEQAWRRNKSILAGQGGFRERRAGHNRSCNLRIAGRGFNGSWWTNVPENCTRVNLKQQPVTAWLWTNCACVASQHQLWEDQHFLIWTCLTCSCYQQHINI